MSAPEEVDVEALAKAGYAAFFESWAPRFTWEGEDAQTRRCWLDEMTAILADLTAQGFALVRREDLDLILGMVVDEPTHPVEKGAYARLLAAHRAALTAAQDASQSPYNRPQAPDPD